jgi:hypothetical protein
VRHENHEDGEEEAQSDAAEQRVRRREMVIGEYRTATS